MLTFRRWLTGSLSAGALAGALLITLLSALGSASDQWWVSEVLSQPRPQYALGLLVCLPVALLRFRRAAWLSLIPLLWNVATFAPLYAGAPAAAHGRATTVLHYNLDNTISDHAAAFAYLRGQPAEILSLQELTPELDRRLEAELPGYQVVYRHPMPNSHGSALLLRRDAPIALVSAEIVHLPDSSVRPIIAAVLEIERREVAFLSLHVIRPVSEWNSGYQQLEFDAAAAWGRAQQAQGRPVLMIGDFNSTPWSPHFRRLLRAGQLEDSARGFGEQPTWPATLPDPLRIPIDQCVHSAEITITSRAAGPFLGSDHTPIVVGFAIER
jgi:endonuclease/exonuclease/phosphatase (EEP) superfamily protein YafD